MNELVSILDNGWCFALTNDVRRVDGESVVRVNWRLWKEGDCESESDWPGFVSSEECLNNMIESYVLHVGYI